VSGDEQWRVSFAREPLREFAREGRLTSTLEPGKHDHGRRVLGELDAPCLTAEDGDELVVDDLHDLLRRVERLRHFVAEGALAHLAGELLDDLERDVRVEGRTPDFANGAVDVGRAELALAAEVLERVGEAIGEVAKCCHGEASLTRVASKQGAWTARRTARRGPAPRA